MIVRKSLIVMTPIALALCVLASTVEAGDVEYLDAETVVLNAPGLH